MFRNGSTLATAIKPIIEPFKTECTSIMSGAAGENVLNQMIGDTKCMNYGERDSFGCPLNSADLCLEYNYSDPIFTDTVLTEFNIFCDRASEVR